MNRFMHIFAEVADKESSITEIWCISLFLCVGGFLLCRWRRIAGVIVLPVAALWAWALFSEINDPDVGPAILRELGRSYVAQAYVATLIPFVFVAIGAWRRRDDAA